MDLMAFYLRTMQTLHPWHAALQATRNAAAATGGGGSPSSRNTTSPSTKYAAENGAGNRALLGEKVLSVSSRSPPPKKKADDAIVKDEIDLESDELEKVLSVSSRSPPPRKRGDIIVLEFDELQPKPDNRPDSDFENYRGENMWLNFKGAEGLSPKQAFVRDTFGRSGNSARLANRNSAPFQDVVGHEWLVFDADHWQWIPFATPKRPKPTEALRKSTKDGDRAIYEKLTDRRACFSWFSLNHVRKTHKDALEEVPIIPGETVDLEECTELVEEVTDILSGDFVYNKVGHVLRDMRMVRTPDEQQQIRWIGTLLQSLRNRERTETLPLVCPNADMREKALFCVPHNSLVSTTDADKGYRLEVVSPSFFDSVTQQEDFEGSKVVNFEAMETTYMESGFALLTGTARGQHIDKRMSGRTLPVRRIVSAKEVVGLGEIPQEELFACDLFPTVTWRMSAPYTRDSCIMRTGVRVLEYGPVVIGNLGPALKLPHFQVTYAKLLNPENSEYAYVPVRFVFGQKKQSIPHSPRFPWSAWSGAPWHFSWAWEFSLVILERYSKTGGWKKRTWSRVGGWQKSDADDDIWRVRVVGVAPSVIDTLIARLGSELGVDISASSFVQVQHGELFDWGNTKQVALCSGCILALQVCGVLPGEEIEEQELQRCRTISRSIVLHKSGDFSLSSP
ncbi:unnamed protein product [Amoebophrya sp. A25]|nr:unnamed protein product [Amoebophrya sp. A25]|eukprot:GSA25T00010097001.1